MKINPKLRKIILFVVFASTITLIISYLTEYYQIMGFHNALNIMLVTWLVLITYAYVLETQLVVKESRKSNRREYLEHKIRDFYSPVQRFLVVEKANDVSGSDNEQRWLTPTDIKVLDKSIIGRNLYLASPRLRHHIWQILNANQQNPINQQIFDETFKWLTEELNDYMDELERITQL